MRIALAIVAAMLLGTCSPPASVLDRVLYSGELRVVTRNSPSAYYLGASGPEGPEFALAERFAASLGVNLYIYSKATLGEVMAEVESGRAHLAAAGLTQGQALPPQLAFGPSYQQVKEHLIYRMGASKPRDLAEAAPGHIEVATNSAHAATLEQLRLRAPDLSWVENPGAETEELLNRLAAQEFDYTVADSNEFAISRSYHPELRVAFDLSQGKSLAWALDARDDSLAARVAAFFASLQTTGELAQILERYYSNVRRFEYAQARDFIEHANTRLPAYREWFKQAAEQNGIDWRLLTAIGYQESNWMPTATSPTGVRGLMMLTSNTAASLGVTDRLDPMQSIFGGARYFVLTRNRVPARIREPDRTWFALAAYNVGIGHLEDARVLTQNFGKNPDR